MKIRSLSQLCVAIATLRCINLFFLHLSATRNLHFVLYHKIYDFIIYTNTHVLMCSALMYLQIDTFSPNSSQLLLCVCITAWLQQVCDIDCILFWRICQSIQWISPFTDSPFRGVSVDSPISHLQLFSQNSIPHCCTWVCFHTESCHHSVGLFKSPPASVPTYRKHVGTWTGAEAHTTLKLQSLPNTWYQPNIQMWNLPVSKRKGN